MHLCLRAKLSDRPIGPDRIVFEDIDENVRVDEQHEGCSVVTAQQRHQLVGAPLDLRLASRRLESIAFGRGSRRGLLKYDLPRGVDGKIDAVAGREPQRVPYPLGNRHLALAGDRGGHWGASLSNTKCRMVLLICL